MVQIDPMSRVPIYEQIKSQLERFILTGTISPGEQIPSVRNMSLELSVNPVTILKAYSELDSQGLIHSVPGRGYFVCDGAREAISKKKALLLDAVSDMAAEMALAGIPEEMLLERISAAYRALRDADTENERTDSDD